jgi:hypothetical protein
MNITKHEKIKRILRRTALKTSDSMHSASKYAKLFPAIPTLKCL